MSPGWGIRTTTTETSVNKVQQERGIEMVSDFNDRIELRGLRQRLEELERRMDCIEGQRSNDYATPEEAASILKMSQNNIYRLIRTRKIKAEKIGRSYRISMSQFNHSEDNDIKELKEKIFGSD
jgi:excisionase family DNA binding protein